MNHNLRLPFLILAVASLLAPAVHAVTQVHYTFTNGQDQSTPFQLNSDEVSILYPSSGVSATLSGPITGTGTLWKQNWGTITLTGANDYYGDTTIMTGTLVIGVDNAIPFSAGKTLQVSEGTLDIGAHTLSVDNFYLSNGAVTGTTGHIDFASGFTFNSSLSYGTTVAVAFGGTGNMQVGGLPGAVLTLTGENTFSGGTGITSNGSLQIGNNGTSGSITGNVVNYGSLTFSRSDNTTFAGNISGSGQFVQKGGGTLTLTGNNTYTGGTTVSAGTLALGSDLTTSPYFVVGNASIDLGSHNASVNRIYFGGSGTVTGTTGVVTVAVDIQPLGGTSTVSAIVAGTGGIAMSTSGVKLTLTRDNTFTGATNVSAGTLSVNGSTSTSSVVTVSGTGVLGGSGTIGGATTIQSGGTLAPGNSPGLLTFGGDLTLDSGSTSVFQIDGTDRGTTYDAVNVAGITTFGGTLALDFSTIIADGNVLNLFGGTGTKTGDFDYITATGSYSGSFTDNNGYWTLVSGGQTLAFSTVSGNLAFGVSAVPEPSTWAGLAGLAALGLAFIRRRSARSASSA